MGLHIPIKSTRRRCTLCSRNRVQKRTSIQCKECKVALCSAKQNNCFELYHQNLGRKANKSTNQPANQLYHQLICIYPWLQNRFLKPETPSSTDEIDRFLRPESESSTDAVLYNSVKPDTPSSEIV